jgi:transglutaminase/protease-like cytokinesis protein 3
MKKKMQFFIIAIGVLFCTNGIAQTNTAEFKQVDEYVAALGSLDTLNMGTISYTITKKFTDNKQKVRAIFDWIAYNISYDCKAARANDNEKNTADIILKTRKATASGYAALFQDMCSVVKIRCLTVDGYGKRLVEEIGEKPDQFNHTWAVVQLGQSQEDWHYIDPTWGSGYTDEKVLVYTKKYNDNYFFANKTIFNYHHFPDNTAWLLGVGSKSVKEFLQWPVVQNAAYDFGIANFLPLNGKINAKVNMPISFSFKINTDIPIQIVAIEYGDNKKKKLKTVDYKQSGSTISFTYKFDAEEMYTVNVLINNAPILGYLVQVTE